ncbi:MAG: type II 3-dehydroquinate dehydratase [Pseudomonadota bacterium]
MPKILILTGPNLNLLGRREPEIYGHDTLDDIHAMCADEAQTLGYEIDCRQSNHEGLLVDWIQEAMDDFDGIIINAAAYTHTSIAIHDALKMTGKPIIEVHISDPDTREEFRHHSYIRPLAKQVIKGQGAKGYVLALQAFSTIL